MKAVFYEKFSSLKDTAVQNGKKWHKCDNSTTKFVKLCEFSLFHFLSNEFFKLNENRWNKYLSFVRLAWNSSSVKIILETYNYRKCIKLLFQWSFIVMSFVLVGSIFRINGDTTSSSTWHDHQTLGLLTCSTN